MSPTLLSQIYCHGFLVRIISPLLEKSSYLLLLVLPWLNWGLEKLLKQEERVLQVYFDISIWYSNFFQIVNCGGISSAVVSANGSSYLNTCEKLTGATAAWASMGTLTVARAFAGIATVPGDVVYILGGYNKDNGFLDSAEKLASGAAAFTPEATMNLPEKKSHFCLVMASAVIFIFILKFLIFEDSFAGQDFNITIFQSWLYRKSHFCLVMASPVIFIFILKHCWIENIVP